jgi:tripartite-type tricarboxylate transporter receptor subunit TctC
MKLPRRTFLYLAAGAAALPAASRFAWAQSYPTRPVHLIVPFAAGSSPDIVARLLGQGMSESLGQQLIIENRPGSGSNIGTEAVVRARPDGYTLLMASVSNTYNATLYEKLNFNFIRDIAPVAAVNREPLVMEVNPSVPVKTVPEFIAYAKANPHKINMASSGVGTSLYVSGELFKMLTGVNLVHVPYPAAVRPLTGLLAGEVQVMFGPVGSSLEYIRTGKLRALAVTTAMRSEALPDTPTLGDFVPGYESSNWFGIGAPKGTPAAIIEKLNRSINTILADPKMKARLAEMGNAVLAGSPSDFGKFIADETERWAKVVKFSGAKPD